MAFDLTRFELGYEIGTDHPSLEWSSRPSGGGRHYQARGPDGFDRPDPLGLPRACCRPTSTIASRPPSPGGSSATMARGASGNGPTFNWGHHYGFPCRMAWCSRGSGRGWPRFNVTTEGEVGMRTWTEEDARFGGRSCLCATKRRPP